MNMRQQVRNTLKGYPDGKVFTIAQLAGAAEVDSKTVHNTITGMRKFGVLEMTNTTGVPQYKLSANTLTAFFLKKSQLLSESRKANAGKPRKRPDTVDTDAAKVTVSLLRPHVKLNNGADTGSVTAIMEINYEIGQLKSQILTLEAAKGILTRSTK